MLSELERIAEASEAMRYLGIGETQNCCKKNSPESCIMPIRGAGIHLRPEASQNAIRLFGLVLSRTPHNDGRHLIARWLLNVAHMTLGSYPDGVPAAWRIPPEAFESDVDFPRFENVSAAWCLMTSTSTSTAIST